MLSKEKDDTKVEGRQLEKGKEFIYEKVGALRETVGDVCHCQLDWNKTPRKVIGLSVVTL